METFRPELIGKQIAFCMRNDCPKGDSCIRSLAFNHAPISDTWLFIDPRLPIGDDCHWYLKAEVIKLARGFKKGVLLVPYGKVGALRDHLCQSLGCARSLYYDFASGKQTLSPLQQKSVTQIFKKLGVMDVDIFDGYEEGYLLP